MLSGLVGKVHAERLSHKLTVHKKFKKTPAQHEANV